jgi:hypothetical protein
MSSTPFTVRKAREARFSRVFLRLCSDPGICERWKRGLKVAPVFPSLIQEGRTGGGYDVLLEPGFPLFLQFKISQYMARA